MRTWIFTAPVVAVAVFQLSGCTNSSAVTPPPAGGIYRSASAGALFEQSVTIKDPVPESITHVADFAFRGAHRPSFSPDTIYVAAGSSGYAVSRDDGETWQAIKVPLTSVLDIVALEQNIVVVTGIDGEGQGYILRTSDEGKSWQTVLTIPVPAKTGGFQPIKAGNSAQVATIVISIAPDPFNPNRLYAGTSLGNVFVGEHYGKTWHKIHNVDQDAFSGNQAKFAVADLIPSPHQVNEMIIITTGGRMYYLNEAGEQKDIKIPQHLEDTPVISLGQSRAVMSASFIDQYPDALLVGVVDGAVISRDRGATWQALSLPVDTLKRFNTVVVRVSPTNPDRLLIAINDAVYRSEDSGASWNTFSLSLPVHVITDLLINPTNAASVLAITTPPRT